MKKVLCTVLALAMALALLAGCGGAPASSGSTAASGSAGNAENATIKVAALVSGYENTYPGMWQEVCDAFTAQTGINVELTLEQNLEDVLNASMQGGDYPDVIHLATGRPAGLTEQFINGKMIADITDVLDMTVPGEDVKVGDKIIEGFTETSATNPYGDGKTYLAPMFYSPCGLFYNAACLRKKAGSAHHGDEMWSWATRPWRKAFTCSPTPPPATLTLSCMPDERGGRPRVLREGHAL
ncbi:MAG: extracellular solute-binding protein [Ruthenibacterium sp.]